MRRRWITAGMVGVAAAGALAVWARTPEPPPDPEALEALLSLPMERRNSVHTVVEARVEGCVIEIERMQDFHGPGCTRPWRTTLDLREIDHVMNLPATSFDAPDLPLGILFRFAPRAAAAVDEVEGRAETLGRSLRPDEYEPIFADRGVVYRHTVTECDGRTRLDVMRSSHLLAYPREGAEALPGMLQALHHQCRGEET